MPLAELSNVTREYSDHGKAVKVLHEVSFRALQGEVALLLGPSGSGKSTLLTILAGLQPPTSGQVMLFGKQVDSYSRNELQRLRASQIGFIFQAFHLIGSLNALENIMMVMRFNHLDRRESRKRSMALLKKFNIEYLSHAYPGRMSQGEKQRVAVARALANDAKLIIADEPTGSLATDQGMKIVRLLREAATEEGRSIVIASHDTRIGEYADKVYRLRDGRVV